MLLLMLWCFLLVFFSKCCAAPGELPLPPTTLTPGELVVEDQAVRTFEVPYGRNAILFCGSNDKDHNFLFWKVQDNAIIGPGNKFDNRKYNYEILTGNLIIRAVSPQEEGIYMCFSRGVKDDSFNVRTVRMVVKKDWEEVYESDSSVNFFRVIIVLASALIIAALLYLAYKIRKRRRLHEYLENEENSDDEESADEIFRAPGTSKSKSGNIVLDKAASIDTDFGSILDNAQQK